MYGQFQSEPKDRRAVPAPFLRLVNRTLYLLHAIFGQGWFEFRRQLEYKLAWNGGWLIAVPPQHMSGACPEQMRERG
jgi:hypothetical protein